MSRGLRYITPARRKSSNPLRAIPLLRSPATVWGTAFYDGTWNQPKAEPVPIAASGPAPVAILDSAHELRAAEAVMREAVRVYDFARREIGEANRTHTAEVRSRAGEVLIPAKPYRSERIRERKSAAFRLFNLRRAQLFATRRRLDAARLALSLPLDDAAARLAGASVAGRA